ncbi:MAG: CubicO group peptidase (beta-lactamase class C family) [Planctomycetota bacterium]|jgi:CubicO group peptidase (beta-lactamase class C family)
MAPFGFCRCPLIPLSPVPRTDMSTSRLLLSLSAGLALSAVAAAQVKPTLEQRLDKLAVSLEWAREKVHIPGMSIAIVKDDEVIWARGFGLADVEGELAADAETVYGVGSTTKAFTAALAGMLVDEGQLGLDDPVTKHLPYFDLQVQSELPDAVCTLRDLLSHRHGFSRMGILVIGGQASREEVLRTAAGAEAWGEFRQDYHYCNVTYMAAGQAAGVAAGSSWEELMRSRLLEPLGMDSSALSYAGAQANERLAVGYRFDESSVGLVPAPLINLDVIAPAGAVSSTVLDMAQWLRLQLGEGEIDGKRLVSRASILESWSPQISMNSSTSYGLGWMLSEYEGRKVVEHGGNVDGFSAQVGMIPEEGLGYVLLMNLSAAPLQRPSLELVFDAMLGEWPEEMARVEAGATEDVVLDDYVGTYIANFGKFRDAAFDVGIEGGIEGEQLTLKLPRQEPMALKSPDANGVWGAVKTEQVKLSFDRDSAGEVDVLRLHANGFRFSVPREGVSIAPEVPKGSLDKYTGSFVRAQGGKLVTVLLARGHLVFEDRGNHMAFGTPDEDGHAVLRDRPAQGATFKLDADDNVESFLFHGNAGAKLFTRKAAEADVKLPSLDEVLALRSTEARIAGFADDISLKYSGKVFVANAGARGTLTVYVRGNARFANHMDFGKFGRISTVMSGKRAWSHVPLRGTNELEGDELAEAFLSHPAAVEGDWSHYFDSVEVIGRDEVNGRSVHVVRLSKVGLPSRTYRIDAENGDLLRVNQVTISGPMKLPVTITYSDFKDVYGIRTAMRTEIENPASGTMILTVENVELGVEFSDEVFTLD